MAKAIDVDGYLNARGELRVTLRQGHSVEHYGRTLVPALDRAAVVALMAELQDALNFDDTAGNNEGAR